MDFTNKTCVVTGASRGIGHGIAENFGAQGANVVVNYRSSEGDAHDVVDNIEDDGGTAFAIQADVTVPSEVEAMQERVHEAFGPIDVLVNNAGITRDTMFADMTYEEWNQVVDVNLNGTFNSTKVFYDDIKEAEHGRLINISSVIGKQGNFGQVNYAATKSAIFGFTRSLALELAPANSTANCVAPGYTQTDMFESVPEEAQDRIRSEIPLDRFAEIDEIASVVCFLASEKGSYITGEVLDVNGALDL